MHAQSKSSASRIYWLDVARVVAIISITLNHAVNRTYENYTDQAVEFSSISLLSSVFKAIITVFSHIGVPLFLMISGTLLLKKKIDDEADVRRFYKHNLLGLFITSEVWYFIMFWVQVLSTWDGHLLREQGIAAVIWRLICTMLFIDQFTFESMWYMPMILCLYLLMPLLAMVLRKISLRMLVIPILIVFFSSMVFSNLNAILSILGSTKAVSFELYSGYLFSFFFLFVIVGYWISQGGLQKMRTWLVALITFALFAGICIFQLWVYSCEINYLVNYDFFAMLPCAAGTFELIRRGAHWIKRLERPVTYLSQISFGIYFVHIIIMSELYWYVDLAMLRPVRLLFLEAVSFLGSIIIIALLSKIPLLKRYMFMIKDGKPSLS